MLISHEVTLGQITFILRVLIQILSYGGLFISGMIVLATIPRVASAETHGMINRIVGRSSAIQSSIKWAFRYWRRKSSDRVNAFRFLIAVLLFVFYSLFAIISDVGFIGFYVCSAPYPSFTDFPASVSTDDLARAVITNNLRRRADPASVTVHRCDVSVEWVTENFTRRACTSWHNSTYADPDVFRGLNSTDSDVLMLRYLGREDSWYRPESVNINSFYTSPGAQRVVDPLVINGLAVVPHPTGVRAVVGVPQLTPQQSVTLAKTMAVEADVGCMALGVYSHRNLDTPTSRGIDIYATNGTWRTYTGPEYLRDVLATYVDQVRELFLQLFDPSSIDQDGFMFSRHESSATFSRNAAVRSPDLYDEIRVNSMEPDFESYIQGNCSQAVRQRLNITVPPGFEDSYRALRESCSVLALAGSIATADTDIVAISRMLCTSAVQVNMVSATVKMNASGSVSVDLTRLPSDLNYLFASYGEFVTLFDENVFADYLPVERFTLGDNPSGPTSHYIPFKTPGTGLRVDGPGSGGNVISRLGSAMINARDMDRDDNFAALLAFDEGNRPLNFQVSTAILTNWSGQIGASYLVNSLAFNGWAARAAAPVTVVSTGGRTSTCYRPLYGIAFMPLVFTAVFVLGWGLLLVAFSSFAGHKRLADSYGGLSPYVGAMCPTHEEDTLLAWQNDEKPRLVILTAEQRLQILDDGPTTALAHLHSPQSPGL